MMRLPPRGLLLAGTALGLLVLAPLAGTALFLRSIDPVLLKARIVAEVQRATGRQLSIGGPVRLGMLPELSIDADDVALANPPGFSRPAMLAAHHVHAAVALLPLLRHRVVLRTLDLTAPDLRLERNAAGVANWVFVAVPRTPATQPVQRAARQEHLRLDALTILGASVTDGALAWQAAGSAGSISISSARLQEVNASSTIYLSASMQLAGTPVTIEGRFGGQAHLWNPADRAEWPVDAKLESRVGTIDVTGSVTQPRRLAGYDVTVHAQGPDLGQLALPWPELGIPRLQTIVLDARVIDRPDGIDIPRLELTAGASDIGASVSGLSLSHLEIKAPNIDGTNGTQTNRFSIGGQYDGQLLELDGKLGPIGRLFGHGQAMARTPILTDARATVAGASIELHGRVAPFGDWAGTDATLQATIPDLAALAPLAGRALPKLHDLSLGAAIASQRGVLSLHAARLQSPAADIGVEGTARLAGRPGYAGTLTIRHLDLDALRAAWPVPAAATVPDPGTQAEAPSPSPWLIPDHALPFARLGAMDADIGLTIGDLLSHGVTVTDIAAHLLLAKGVLTIDPFTASFAGARLSASLTADAGRAPPAMAMTLHAPGIDSGKLLALLGVSQTARGTLDLDATLAGNGESPHAIAGTLEGHLGVALTGGAIDNRVLADALAYLVPVSRIGLSLPGSGMSTIACLATRLDLREGVAVPRAFLLDLGTFHLAAAGAIDLRDETFALRVRPYVRLGAAGLVLPSHVDGSWRSPRLTLEPASGAASTAETVAALLAGRDSSLSAALANLAGSTDPALADADTGDCTQALAAARDPSDTIPPIAAAPPPPAHKTRREKAVDLLRRLFKQGGG